MTGAEYRNRRSTAGEEGVVLLLTLFIVALFSILVLEFNYSTRVEYHVAATCRDELLALNIAKAGVFETIALLREDRLREIEEKEEEDEEKGHPSGEVEKLVKERAKSQAPGARKDIQFPDHYGEDWARERNMEPFGPGYLSLKVIDESGKININTLVKEQKKVTAAVVPTPTPSPGGEAPETAAAAETPKPPPREWGQKDRDMTGEQAAEEKKEGEPEEPEPVRYVVDKKVEKDIMRLLETLKVRGVDPEKVTAAIVDWMDSNDDGDWEDDAYRDAGDGSVPKNAPLDTLSELLMIKGVTGDLYFGPGRPEESFLEDESGRAAVRKKVGPGLRDCLTVCSKSKVNVNTAPPEVLASLLEEENESLVREITAYTRKRYFKDMNEFEKEIGEAIPASLKANACVGSDSFQIIAEGRVNEARKQVQAFVYRDDEANVKVLYWRVVP